MAGNKSRDKGARGELEIAHRIGGKRVGYAYVPGPVDVEVPNKSVWQVKNCSIGGSRAAGCLDELEKVAPELERYVVFKARRGDWIVCQRLDQFLSKQQGEPKLPRQQDKAGEPTGTR